MRAQVLLPLLVFGLLAVVSILVPIGEGIAVTRTQQLTLARSISMDQIASRAEAALASGESAALVDYLGRFHDTYGESILVVDDGGEVVAAVGDIALDDATRALVVAATRSVPPRTLPTVYPWSGERQLVAESFATGSSGALGAVVLAVDLSTARADVTQRWVLVGLVGVLLLAVLLAASLAWTNWVLRPVRALDAAANALAEQRNPNLHPPTGPRELRRLSASFARMSRAVEEALEQQRGFVAEASHQLRNPLAAIRLRFDAGQVADDGFDAIAHDVDRLEHVVDRMLVLANAEHRATAEASAKGAGFAEGASHEHTTSAADLVGASVRRLAAAGVELRAARSDGTRPAAAGEPATTSEHGATDRDPADDAVASSVPDTGADARARAGAGAVSRISLGCRRSDLEEIVEILLDNARAYAGTGARVTLDLRVEGPFAVLEIADDGPGLDPEDLAHLGTRFWRAPEHRSRPGTGLGLAIVGQLARANGGDVTYDRATAGGLRVRVRFERVS